MKRYTRSLAGLVRFRMDAALSTDYKCYVWERGKLIRKYLTDLKPGLLERQCRSEVEKLMRGGRGLEGLKIDSVCTDQQAIQARISELIEGIDKKIKCGPEDFWRPKWKTSETPEGCVTGDEKDIQKLNRLIGAEPGSILHVID